MSKYAMLVILVMSLAACQTAKIAPAPPTTAASRACPPVATYSREDQARAAAELRALPRGSQVARLIGDYGVLREQARACRR